MKHKVNLSWPNTFVINSKATPIGNYVSGPPPGKVQRVHGFNRGISKLGQGCTMPVPAKNAFAIMMQSKAIAAQI